jgi:hypothetical protein
MKLTFIFWSMCLPIFLVMMGFVAVIPVWESDYKKLESLMLYKKNHMEINKWQGRTG